MISELSSDKFSLENMKNFIARSFRAAPPSSNSEDYQLGHLPFLEIPTTLQFHTSEFLPDTAVFQGLGPASRALREYFTGDGFYELRLGFDIVLAGDRLARSPASYRAGIPLRLRKPRPPSAVSSCFVAPTGALSCSGTERFPSA